MSNLMGLQAKYLLESTFDSVCNSSIVYVSPEGNTIPFNAIIHDEIVRARREHLTIDNQSGISDRQSKRVILLTRDLHTRGMYELSSAGYFLLENKQKEYLERYDFSTNEPFCDLDTTPFADANQVFTVFYIRRAIELESQIPPVEGGTGAFSFNDWKLS